MNERWYGVWLYHQRIGSLGQRGDYTWFRFSDEYLQDPNRSVLGLVFEENLGAQHASALRLPAWFSNLLPEGRLRDWIARDRGVSGDREMELLAQVGHDLPGAVQVVEADRAPDWLSDIPVPDRRATSDNTSAADVSWRFSLAGVGLKFSMVRTGDRLTLPAYGEGGDWIVKLPDLEFKGVPTNEHAMMSIAGRAGIEVPEHILIHRAKLQKLPENVWPGTEEYAYAVRRFDRGSNRELVHIEDFAQVRNIYPYGDGKYQGNFETVAALAYRGFDVSALQQVARRLAFNILITNSDAHLKNWSLIYRDRRRPTLSPAYDLVSTEFYRQYGLTGDLGLKLGKSRRFELVSLATFERLEDRLGARSAHLVDCVVDTVDRVIAAWPDVAPLLDGYPELQQSIDTSMRDRRKTILRS